jgi:ATP-dependent exoDNAse (exonuclease V) alpha subunit
MFMSPFDYVRMASHPYVKTSPKSHGHFKETPLPHPAYSAPALPFNWMLSKNMDDFAKEYGIDVDKSREPVLGFPSTWVQEISNQRALLDCFFEHVQKERSLCFFYAKQVPFVEDTRRIIIGVGRVLNVGQPVEYEYSESGKLRSMLWERMVSHSIRPNNKDGFILPYHAALELEKRNPDFDPSKIAAFAPQDRMVEFSYATEHVTQDGAIQSLLSCAASLRKAKDVLNGPWENCLQWIDARLAEVWKMRGPCPGLGAALCAFGLELGTFVAREISAQIGENEDPWPLVDKMFHNPKSVLSPSLWGQVGSTLREAWQSLPADRRLLLKLISRFDILPDQAVILYVEPERKKAGIQVNDRDIIMNPYLAYELTRLTSLAIGIETVDRGVFPENIIRQKHPLPAPSALDAGNDKRRIRALAIETLEQAANEGHTLLAQEDVILKIRDLELQPPCDVTQDIMPVAEKIFASEIEPAELADGRNAYQLHHLSEAGKLIRTEITRRIGGKRHQLTVNWRALLDSNLSPVSAEQDELEEVARREKAAALQELAESRFSVLIGEAGTGKTTLLAILCSQSDIADGEILLLAPTGKARVRMEQVARDKNLKLKALTLAQHLNPDRYNGEIQRYHLSDKRPSACPRTVIVDEASMLTEEMLAALFESLSGVQRLILVGDPRQLPPIGSGRPFVDIVNKLKPENIESIFPKIGKGYAELTILRRQAGQERKDRQLANWFSGNPVGSGDDDIFDALSQPDTNMEFLEWNSPEELQTSLLQVLVKELEIKGVDDIAGFNEKLGAVTVGAYSYFNRGKAQVIDKWQILSPVRSLPHGVRAINRLVHKTFRAKTIADSRKPDYQRKLPKPLGDEEIVYGDKVINNMNHTRLQRYGRSLVYPQDGASGYIANGEIGLVVGIFKTPKLTRSPWALKVEFSSQPGYEYEFPNSEFGGEDANIILELAYALTVHKAQGSEFGTVILVLPNPCRLLSRELIYTALTRQTDRIVILHQGNKSTLRLYTSDTFSEIARRLTNLFEKPKLVQVGGRFLEENLIHIAKDHQLLRSKSELIIYEKLLDRGLRPFYEKPLTFKGKTRYPDFTIEDETSGNYYYWEHCGMMADPVYRRRWEKKLNWYQENGILRYQDGGGEHGILIVTEETPDGGFSSAAIENVIDEVFGI